MIRNSVLCSVALVSIFWCAAAFAQNDSAAAAPTPAAPAASDTLSPSSAASASSAQPGDDVIHLHMPAHRARHVATPSQPAESPTVDAIGADTSPSAAPAPSSLKTPPPPAPTAAPTKQTKPSNTTEQQSGPTIPFSFGEPSEPVTPSPPAAPQKKASTSNAPSARETRTASLPPRPVVPQALPAPVKATPATMRAKNSDRVGLTKRGAVLFDKGVSNPSAAQFKGVKLLANDVSTALETGAARVQLEAYGGSPGDKSSEARRLSLKRALAVRQLFIDDGIPSNRIDVRAMGGADDKGPNDRVDVFLRAS